jgi:hypothetical protein
MSSFNRHSASEVPNAARADLLASDQRCRLLRALAAADGQASVRDLAVRVLVQQTDRPAEQIDSDAIESLRYEIYDRHLPKLAMTGVVEYDSVLDKLRLVDSDVSTAAKRALDS